MFGVDACMVETGRRIQAHVLLVDRIFCCRTLALFFVASFQADACNQECERLCRVGTILPYGHMNILYRLYTFIYSVNHHQFILMALSITATAPFLAGRSVRRMRWCRVCDDRGVCIVFVQRTHKINSCNLLRMRHSILAHSKAFTDPRVSR